MITKLKRFREHLYLFIANVFFSSLAIPHFLSLTYYSLRGEVKFPTGGESPRLPQKGTESVKFRRRRLKSGREKVGLRFFLDLIAHLFAVILRIRFERQDNSVRVNSRFNLPNSLFTRRWQHRFLLFWDVSLT